MPRTRPQKFVHVVYRTRRFDAMLRWSTLVFDAKLRHQNPAPAFLTCDDEHHRFAFAELGVLRREGRETDRADAIDVDPVACTCASLDDLLENHVQLEAHGIVPCWCVHHGETVSMVYADPDGKQMEFQVDSCASNDEANAFMESPHFAVEPIGVEYDPEDWLARMRAGTGSRLLATPHAPAGIAGARRGGGSARDGLSHGASVMMPCGPKLAPRTWDTAGLPPVWPMALSRQHR